MTRDARMVAGVTLVTVPTILYGGLVLLGVLTAGGAGAPGPTGPTGLTPAQVALYRAGHAHAGVLLILSLVVQVLLDHAAVRPGLAWSARIAAPAAAILVSAGFFGLAHVHALRVLLYAGAALLVWAVLVSGVGLIRGAARG